MKKKISIIAIVTIIIIAAICWIVFTMVPNSNTADNTNDIQDNTNIENVNGADNENNSSSYYDTNSTSSASTDTQNIDTNTVTPSSPSDEELDADGEVPNVRELGQTYDGYDKRTMNEIMNGIQYENVNNENTMDRNLIKQAARSFAETYYSKTKDRHTAMGTMLNVSYIESEGTNNILYMDYVLGQAQPLERIQSMGDPVVNNAQRPNLSVTVPLVLSYDGLSDQGTELHGTVNIDLRIQMDDQYKVKSIYKQSK